MTRLRAAALMSLSALLLSGCTGLPWGATAQVPESGPVQQGDEAGVTQQDNFIRVIPQPPHDGMTQEQVVQGFLDASAASEDDHAVARQFLTSAASAGWDANAGTRVYKGTPALTTDGLLVRFSAVDAGAITSDATFATVEVERRLNRTFDLVKANGQWRISGLSPGLLLSTIDVQRAYRSLAVYFFNPQGNTLVPDARMVAVPGTGLATGLVNALIAGPSPWLKPAVHTAFPLGVGLNFDIVSVENGIANVDLTADAQFAGDGIRRGMAQQLVWTLRQLPQVSAVRISAGGQLMAVEGVPSPIPRDQWPELDPSGMERGAAAIVADEAGVMELVPTGTRRVAPVPLPRNSEFTEVVTNGSLGMLAGIDALGRVWSTPLDANPTWSKLAITAAVRWLEYDPNGGLWVWDAAGGLAVWDAPGPVKPIQVRGLPAKSTLVRAVPSRDGTRAALILKVDGEQILYLARIEQEITTNVRIIDGARRVAGSVSDVIDVDWSGANSLAFLGKSDGGVLQAFDVDLARGTLLPQGGPSRPETIAAAPGLPLLIAATNGAVYELDAGSWIPRVAGWSPAYPS